jgi:hypothetical protein
MRDVEIRVGDEPPSGTGQFSAKENALCRDNITLSAYDVGTFRCNLKGRFVVIRIADIYRVDNSVLSICEVEVFLGHKYAGCGVVQGVNTNVTAFARWEALTDNRMELCAAVCAAKPTNSMLFGVTNELAQAETVGLSSKCLCNVAVAPPATITETSCQSTKVYTMQNRSACPLAVAASRIRLVGGD